ncbi:hypothetical protein SteCoe_27878 [Stentor coeruleus]|uniref:Uncharacterized protein n=1 Tax=Stentor coeruleus TaxID=5963 RepID=A0A1R2B9I5_9CILI|nr:hypothetical protein SteCoe_27878 [Stentor coeruleus]
MEKNNKVNISRLKKSPKRSRKTPVPEPKAKPIVAAILEESKRLESLNRQINKISGHKIVKYLSNYRKSASQETQKLQNIDSNYSQIYESILKHPQFLLKEPKTLSNNNSDLFNHKQNDNHSKLLEKKPSKPSDLLNISFKSTFWPEESIINNNLYDLQTFNGIERRNYERYYINTTSYIGNNRIKSRIGEFSRKFREKNRKSTADYGKRSQAPRESIPWTYQTSENACIFSPFV